MNLTALAMICFTVVVCVGIVCNTVTNIRNRDTKFEIQALPLKLEHERLMKDEEARRIFELYGGDDESARESLEPPDHEGSNR